jgi:hypothetical protein
MQEKWTSSIYVPVKDKETGIYTFNFNVEEVKNVVKQDEEKESCDIWWCKEATNQPEWMKIDISIVKRDDEVNKEDCGRSNNHYNVL